MVKFNSSGKYLKVDLVAEGDIITFKDAGNFVESQYKYEDGNSKMSFEMMVGYKGEEFKLNVGKYSRDELIPVYGDDSSDWVGKEATIHIENYRSLNKKGIILSPIKQESESKLDENGKEIAWDE